MNLTELCKFATSEIKNINADYSEEKLLSALELILRPSMTDKEITNALIQSSLEMTSEDFPLWQYASAKLYIYDLYESIKKVRNINEPYSDLYDLIVELTNKGLYGKYILDNYSKEDIKELELELKPERDFLFTYSGISLLASRYLIRDYDNALLELPQQMFMGIALHLALPEKKKFLPYTLYGFVELSMTM